jgi:geranylgeranyl diphosphate synthase type II
MTGPSSPGGSGGYADRLRADVAAYLSGIRPDGDPEAFYEACRYALESGGKHVRPMLVLLGAEAYGGSRSEALPAAAACEVFHNFTLVHDDIMDRSEVRRGRPTVHVAFGENTAILVGDYLLSLAYGFLDHTPVDCRQAVRARFATMVARLCEGQALDMRLGGQVEVAMADYLDMIDRKTGALLACCLEIGALIGGADEHQSAAMHRAGLDLGRAFQIQDDLLDATADGRQWGKRRGQDLVEGKQTYLVVDMLSAGPAEGRKRFHEAISRGGFDEGEVDEATQSLETAGVLARAAIDVELYADRASVSLSGLPGGVARDTLLELVEQLARRTH